MYVNRNYVILIFCESIGTFLKITLKANIIIYVPGVPIIQLKFE